jgi:hypothetical protein
MNQYSIKIVNFNEMDPNNPGDNRGLTSGRVGNFAETDFINLTLRDPSHQEQGSKNGWREYSGEGESRNIMHTMLHEISHSIILKSGGKPHPKEFFDKLESSTIRIKEGHLGPVTNIFTSANPLINIFRS